LGRLDALGPVRFRQDPSKLIPNKVEPITPIKIEYFSH